MKKDRLKTSSREEEDAKIDDSNPKEEKPLTLVVSIRVWNAREKKTSKYIYEFADENKHMKIRREKEGYVNVLLNVGYNEVQKKGLFIPAEGLVIPPEGLIINI